MQSTFEWRRNAIGWWLSKAENAHFCALALSRQDGETAVALAANNDYNGTPSIALYEGFRRESAVALELIVKAVIARTLDLEGADPAKHGVPVTHDIPALWKQAVLPELSTEDQYRLLLCKTELIWAGRYPTPKSEAAWEDEEKAFEKLLGPSEKNGKLVIRKPIGFDFEDFDKLYQMALSKVLVLMKCNRVIREQRSNEG